MKKASEYRKHADECRQMMTAATGEQREMLEEMAKTWDGLADDREPRVTQKERIAELEANDERNKRR